MGTVAATTTTTVSTRIWNGRRTKDGIRFVYCLLLLLVGLLPSWARDETTSETTTRMAKTAKTTTTATSNQRQFRSLSRMHHLGGWSNLERTSTTSATISSHHHMYRLRELETASETPSMAPSRAALVTSSLVYSSVNANATTTSIDQVASSIIGGTKVIATSSSSSSNLVYPYFTSVVPNAYYLCGAALIAPDMLITSAHCQVAFVTGAVVGATQLLTPTTAGAQTVQMVEKFVHPYYKDYHDYDVMVLKITPAVTDLTPVSINLDPAVPAPGAPLKIMGFGRTTDSYGSLSKDLLDATISEVATATCQTQFPRVIAESHLCAWEEGKSSGSHASVISPCNGDSGGPIIDGRTGRLVGMLSYSSTTCSAAPSVYTRTSGFADFLQGVLCQHSDYVASYGEEWGCGTCAVQEWAYQACLEQRLGASAAATCKACVDATQTDTTMTTACGSDFVTHVCQAPYTCPCGGGAETAAGQESCAALLQHYLQCQSGCTQQLCVDHTLAPVPAPQTASPALFLPDTHDDNPASFCEQEGEGCHETAECCTGLSCVDSRCFSNNNIMVPSPVQPLSMVPPPTPRQPSPAATTFCGSSFVSCTASADCCAGLTCVNGVCQVFDTASVTIVAQTNSNSMVTCQGETQACQQSLDCCAGMTCRASASAASSPVCVAPS